MTTCVGMYQGSSTTITDLVNCGAANLTFGSFEFLAIICLAAVAVLAFRFKLPYSISLVFGFALVYSFDLIAGGSPLLRMMLVLLAFGIGIVILRGLYSYVEGQS
jgi:hypothetical protein